MISYNPLILAVKYWIDNLAMISSGWVEASAGLLNSHVSQNVGLGDTTPQRDNAYVFRESVMGVVLSVVAIYLVVVFGLGFLPSDIYRSLLSPWIYVLLVVEIAAKLRYYMWLSVSRSYRQDINGVAQLIYAIPTAILTPPLLWFGIHVLHLGLVGVYGTSAIVGLIQALLAEVWFKRKLQK